MQHPSHHYEQASSITQELSSEILAKAETENNFSERNSAPYLSEIVPQKNRS